MGFDVTDGLATRIDYTNDRIRVPLGAHLSKHGLTAELLTQVRTTKATDWAYEREYRVEAELTTQDPATGLYYTDFGPQIQLREVIIGHRCSWTPAKARDLVADNIEQPVRICKARPAFGRFEMVEQRLAKPLVVEPHARPKS